MHQLIDTISTIERELSRVRSVVERRARGLQSDRRRQNTQNRQRSNGNRSGRRVAPIVRNNLSRNVVAVRPVETPSVSIRRPVNSRQNSNTNIIQINSDTESDSGSDTESEDEYENPIQVQYSQEELDHIDAAVLEALLAMDDSDSNSRRRRRPRRVPKLKTRAVKESEINLPLPDNCAICQDNHLKCDSIETSCGHQFGVECFMQWVHTKNNNHQILSCPLCLYVQPKYHGFRARKNPRAAVRQQGVST